MENKEKGKRETMVEKPLNRPTQRAEPGADIQYIYIKTRCVIHRSVCCTRVWKVEERSIWRGCHVRYQWFDLPVIPQQSPEESSDEYSFAICTCLHWERKDGTKLPSLSLKKWIESTKVKISVCKIARCKGYNKWNMGLWMRLPRKLLQLLNSMVDILLLA